MTPLDIIAQQRQRLDMLQALHPKKILMIKAKEGTTPEGGNPRLYTWNYYMDIFHELNEPIYTRGILPNELCFDPDLKDWNSLKNHPERKQHRPLRIVS